ncbi:hypothetical protein HJC99_06135 [Candidatus Saccharibacteria bacterium]|nr:hypothetical protein [Candidatus Saccharibacteria bacterium]
MPKSAQVSGFNVAARNYQDLVNEVLNCGGGDDDMNRLHADRNLRRRIAELLVGKPALNTYPLTIDYDRSLDAMIAAGRYDYASSNITVDNFPVGMGERLVNAVLVQFDHDPSDDEVTRELERLNLRDASMAEGLAFGATYPEIQRQFPIVFRGSVWAGPDGSRSVGYLWGRPGNRRLNLGWRSSDWDADYRFLAVRK